MDHPSFFHSFCSTRADDGFRPADVPSSLSGSAGIASALPGEPGVSLNGDTPPNNKPALSSTADTRRNSSRTHGNKLRSGVKTKMASDPCKPSEAMIKISQLLELPIVCEALHSKPEVASSGFAFLSLLKVHLIIVNETKGKISPPFSGRQRRVNSLSTLSVGQFL
jgi:hypothetical protein